MRKSPSFVSHGKFYAQAQFPYGLARSGEFTCEQVSLLENHGKAYQALHDGLNEPVNDEERDFLAVCRGEREPVTAHEKAWIRFCQKANDRPAISVFPEGHPSMPIDDHREASEDLD